MYNLMLDRHIHCEMITAIKLMKISSLHVVMYVCGENTLAPTLSANTKYTKKVLTIVTMSSTLSLGLPHLT